MNKTRSSNLTARLVAVLCATLVLGTGASAQVLDSVYPDIENPFEKKKEDTREKKYVQKTALRWELSRRYSEHVIEEYLPKFEAIVKRSKPGTSDFTDWRTLGGQLFVSWVESRKHEKTGTQPSDQSDWEKQHNSFLGGIQLGGASLMLWRDGVATETATFQKEADEAAGRFEEIRKNMKVTDPVWSKAIEIAAGASGATWNREKLKEAQDAHAELKGKRDQVASTYSAIQRAYEYALKDKAEKPRTLLSTDEQVTRKNWMTAVSTYPLVQKIYTQPVQEWAKLLQAAYDADVKAWEAMQKAFEPVKKGEIRANSPYKDCPWDSKPSECIQKTLDALATAIASAGRRVEGAEARVFEDKAATEKEYGRYLELIRKWDDRKELRLLYTIDTAATDAEKKQAEKELKEYRASLKKAEEEIVKLKEGHKARRKALGIPPEDWI